MNKKLNKVLSLLLVLVVFLVGCGGKLSEEQVFEKIFSYYSDAKSVPASLEGNFEMKIDQSTISQKIKANANADIENKIFSISLDAGFQKIEVYGQLNDDNSITAFLNLGGQWIGQKSKLAPANSENDFVKYNHQYFLNILKEHDVFTVEKNNGSYILKSDYKKLKEVAEKIKAKEENREFVQPAEDEFDQTEVILDVNEKDFHINSILIKDKNNENKYLKVSELLKTNDSITIPQEALDSLGKNSLDFLDNLLPDQN